MLRLADLVIRYRWWVLFLTVLVTGFLGWKTLSVSLNAEFSTYLSQDDPAVKEYNRIGDLFGGNDVGVVLLNSEEVFSTFTLETISRLTRTYEGVDGIFYATSLTNIIDFRETEWGLEVGTLIDSDHIPIDNVEQIDGYWMGKTMTMKTLDKNHKNELQLSDIRFNQGLSDSKFSERTLKRPIQ